ncbi:DHA2 family efflux MFS transporter permease subunit [Roseibium sediminicola]|uniref:DHA2 family efflux MFS transporter permease subunit n=1 Tax=Roseibium sediminicola TaxID=2933272 RepID=A0ABT0H153_9HYPH|nr:DHA2 family efflux MFS transporter permease subunit [Roseibium sp. CAU 1639]MCK7615422.1 DHA2 family efflux MFS transporter permease subunit [Roseibium sp. CAU 1639]
MAGLSEKGRKRGLVLAMGGLGGLVMLDETILGVSLPAIRSEMGLSPTTTHWIINSYMLTFTCFAAIGGKAIDLFGLRPALIVTSVVFAVASLLAGFADGATMLISMRVVQGLCAAIMFPMTLAAATLTFDETERGRAIGTLAGMATIFLAAGPFLGGVLTDYLSWRWVFWINIPIVVAGTALACFLWRNPEVPRPRPVVDRIGLVLLLIGMTGLIFGLMEGPDFGWVTPAILVSLVAGVIGLAVFIAYEARQAKPLIDVRLFRLKAFHASATVILLTQMSKIVVAIFVPHFLQLEMKYSALAAGLATVVAVLPFPFLSAPAGKFADRHGSRRPVLLSLALLAVANAAIGGLMFMENYMVLAPALLVWGIALPFAMIPTGRLTANSVPKDKQGEVSGLVITARLVGGTLGVTMGSVLLAMSAGFSSIFWVMSALLMLCWAYGATAFVKDSVAAR